MLLAALALIWIACAVGTYGTELAHLQGICPSVAEDEYRSDVGFSLMLAVVFFPVAPGEFFIAACLSGFWQHGWRLK